MKRFLGWVAALALLSTGSVFGQMRTQNVVLVTADGLRHQELFGGLDPVLLESESESGIEDREALRDKFWRDSPLERREVLMPFFWQQLAPEGIVLGNREAGSPVSVTNPHRVSYPGYAEILTGQVQPAISGNDPLRVPRETVLEFVRRALSLERREVAAFTSWNLFPYIVEHEVGTILVNAFGPVPEDLANDEMRRLNQLEARTLSPWSSVRQNVFTESLAMAYIDEHRPRLVFLAFDETDEWAHARRYDKTLEAIRLFDQTLHLLWERLQSMDAYRDKTTLIVTTDHGRGRAPHDWTSHGEDIEGADEIWIAILGPDTPARGILAGAGPTYQNQIAATLLKFFGLDPAAYNPDAGAPIPLAFR